MGVDLDKVLKLLQALHREGVNYVLVGGVAVIFHGILRATEDVDLFVEPTAENVERLKKAMRSVWDDGEIDNIRVEDLAGEYPTIRYGPPGEDLIVDLISRLGTAFQFADLVWETILVEGVPVRIATPETLVRMKRDTLRELDRKDAADLRGKFRLEGD